MVAPRAVLRVILTIALLATPLTADAQTTAKVWRLGLVHVGVDHIPGTLAPFRQELRELGHEEGKNVRLDFRNVADEEAARTTVGDFLRDRVDLIVAWENSAQLRVRQIRALSAASTA